MQLLENENYEENNISEILANEYETPKKENEFMVGEELPLGLFRNCSLEENGEENSEKELLENNENEEPEISMLSPSKFIHQTNRKR
jgi:hypothetical protein